MVMLKRTPLLVVVGLIVAACAASGTETTTSPNDPTTTTGPTTTAQPATSGEAGPVVEIVSPEHLSSHEAVFDPATEEFGAQVSLSASIAQFDNDSVTVEWFSSEEGFLGAGETIIATIHTGQSDAAQPHITVRATDQQGMVGEATIQIIVFIPSDT